MKEEEITNLNLSNPIPKKPTHIPILRNPPKQTRQFVSIQTGEEGVTSPDSPEEVLQPGDGGVRVDSGDYIVD